MTNSEELTPDTVAVVTGGTQGIGFAAVSALAARGVRVVALSRRQEHIEEALASLEASTADRVIGVAADVSDGRSVDEAVGRVVDRFGRIDVLLNCAGVSMSAKRRFVDTTAAEWSRLIQTNLDGTYFMTRAVLPHIERQGGYVINVLSTGAFVAGTGASLYAASKFGARALTEALIEEYRGSSVRITSVSPGPVDTTIWTHKEKPPSEEERARMMRPSDIADVFIWLLERPRRLHVRDITVTPWAAS